MAPKWLVPLLLVKWHVWIYFSESENLNPFLWFFFNLSEAEEKLGYPRRKIHQRIKIDPTTDTTTFSLGNTWYTHWRNVRQKIQTFKYKHLKCRSGPRVIQVFPSEHQAGAKNLIIFAPPKIIFLLAKKISATPKIISHLRK